jgi:hypothetical protein
VATDISRANDVHGLTSERMSSIGTILLVILVIVLLGGFSGFGGGPSTGPAITVAAASALSSLSCWSSFCSASFEPNWERSEEDLAERKRLGFNPQENGRMQPAVERGRR